jgi:hypothetical protein
VALTAEMACGVVEDTFDAVGSHYAHGTGRVVDALIPRSA